jgi:hypothetical protein
MLIHDSPLIHLMVVIRGAVHGLVWQCCMIRSDVRVYGSRKSKEIWAKVTLIPAQLGLRILTTMLLPKTHMNIYTSSNIPILHYMIEQVKSQYLYMNTCIYGVQVYMGITDVDRPIWP